MSRNPVELLPHRCPDKFPTCPFSRNILQSRVRDKCNESLLRHRTRTYSSLELSKSGRRRALGIAACPGTWGDLAGHWAQHRHGHQLLAKARLPNISPGLLSSNHVGSAIKYVTLNKPPSLTGSPFSHQWNEKLNLSGLGFHNSQYVFLSDTPGEKICFHRWLSNWGPVEEQQLPRASTAGRS